MERRDRMERLLDNLYQSRSESINAAVKRGDERVLLGTLKNYADCLFLSKSTHDNMNSFLRSLHARSTGVHSEKVEFTVPPMSSMVTYKNESLSWVIVNPTRETWTF